MGIFRRPELEKDNPTAPQIYVGPRRRRARCQSAARGHLALKGSMVDVLRVLSQAAEQFVECVPASIKYQKERKVLRKAIAEASRLLRNE